MWTTRGGFASETRLVNSQLVTPPYPRSPIPLYNRNAVTWLYPDCSVLSYFIHSIPFLILSISKKCCVAQLSQGGSVFPCATRGRQGTCKATGLTVLLRNLWNFVDQHCWRVGAGGPNRQMSRGAGPAGSTNVSYWGSAIWNRALLGEGSEKRSRDCTGRTGEGLFCSTFSWNI